MFVDGQLNAVGSRGESYRLVGLVNVIAGIVAGVELYKR